MSGKLLLDTNVVLRYLTNDVPAMADDSERLFKKAQAGEVKLFIPDICFAELAWTLLSYYKLDKDDISAKLISIINTPGFYFTDEALLLDALRRFSDKNIDFTDAYNAAVAAKTGMRICSFDKDFGKFSDISAVVPSDIT